MDSNTQAAVVEAAVAAAAVGTAEAKIIDIDRKKLRQSVKQGFCSNTHNTVNSTII